MPMDIDLARVVTQLSQGASLHFVTLQKPVGTAVQVKVDGKVTLSHKLEGRWMAHQQTVATALVRTLAKLMPAAAAKFSDAFSDYYDDPQTIAANSVALASTYGEALVHFENHFGSPRECKGAQWQAARELMRLSLPKHELDVLDADELGLGMPKAEADALFALPTKRRLGVLFSKFGKSEKQKLKSLTSVDRIQRFVDDIDYVDKKDLDSVQVVLENKAPRPERKGRSQRRDGGKGRDTAPLFACRGGPGLVAGISSGAPLPAAE
jgi:hypothetical protein